MAGNDVRGLGRWLFVALAGLALVPRCALAGDGPVALQTAARSCADDSGDVYVDCNNGTVTDNRTGLVWLKDANCFPSGESWSDAMRIVAGLADLPAALDADCGGAGDSCDCDLEDGSSPGEWRLPSVGEWETMIADAVGMGCVGGSGPAITTDSGLGCWSSCGAQPTLCSFEGVGDSYWSSSTSIFDSGVAWDVSLTSGLVVDVSKGNTLHIWPVRGGQ